MKMLVCILLFSLVWQITNAQITVTDSARYEVAKKSKTQRTIGIVLLSAGSVLSVVGLAVGTNKFLSDLPGMVEDNKRLSGSGAMIAGLTLMAGSIPFFVMAGQNRRALLTVSNVPRWEINSGLMTLRSTPQLSLTLTKQIF